MSDWKKEFDKEERLQRQYKEWFEREQEKNRKAEDEGDYSASRRHLDNAKRYHKMAVRSTDRMEQLIPAASGGCLIGLVFLPFRLLLRLFART